MSGARIASSVFVTALLRLAEREGGFGAVVAKGDPNAGSILIVLAERGRRVQVLERLLQPDGNYAWGAPLKEGHNESDLDRFLEKRRRFDPDSWLIELDTASAERFAAEIAALD
jgi:hypothetical protein